MVEGMPDVLKKICATKRSEIQRLRKRAQKTFYAAIDAQTPTRGFRSALQRTSDVALIAEIKKASPSAGVIRDDFEPARIAQAYEAGGARCLSVLTDSTYFQGELAYLECARKSVCLPVLRKDFILDESQILEARAIGADCVLLIVAVLEQEQLQDLHDLAQTLEMDVLVEVHDAEELDRALSAGADLIGINNRNLRTFEVDLNTTLKIAPDVPTDVVCVAESGIKTRKDVELMRQHGVDGILVGESLMRAEDIESATKHLSDI